MDYEICPVCHGSGEGQYSGSVCSSCCGSGIEQLEKITEEDKAYNYYPE